MGSLTTRFSRFESRACAPYCVITTFAAMAVVTTLVLVSLVGAPRAHADNNGDWYGRANAVGIYHGSRLTLGAFLGSKPLLENEIDSGKTESAMGLNVTFEGGWLGAPSAYGNFHGIEYGMGLRLNPNDLWGSIGFPVTFLNIGRGAPGSFRLGGSFGTGIGLVQSYVYFRGRAAAVIVPNLIDVEASVQWTPVGASATWGSAPGDFEDLNARASMWYRKGRSKRAYEVYLEYFERDRRGFGALPEGAQPRQNERDGEVSGVGVGVGISLN